MRFLSRGRSFLGLLALVVPTLLLLAATAVPAKLLPKSQCLNQCQDSITAQCTKTRTLKNGSIKTRIKPACKARLIRLCRKQKAGVCTTTTTTTTTTTIQTTSTTSTPTTSTTTTTCPGGICVQFLLDFANGAPGGNCGTASDASNTVLKTLTCGGLNIGGGSSIVAEGPTPDGSQSRFMLSCADLKSVCSILPYAPAPAVNSADPDCSTTGCNFGTPLPIPNPSIPTLTTCVLNTFEEPASGTLDLTSGASTTNVKLVSDTYLTGNLAQPCPKCSAGGTPSSPGTGTCDRGPRAGMACTSTNSTGYTRDCPTGGVGDATTPCPPPGNPVCTPSHTTNCPCTVGGGNCCDGSHIGPIHVNLSPLTTGKANSSHADGIFCPGQRQAPHAGCFGKSTCTSITENGVAAGAVTLGVPANATLASVFCIAATGNGTVDASADLPGPGAVSLPGTYNAHH